jgi:hypothetical protein
MAAVGLLLSCSKQVPSADAHEHASLPRVAWAGQSDSGLRVLVEPLLVPAHADSVVPTEEELLRHLLGITEEQRILRVSLVPEGEADLPDSPGRLTVGEVIYEPLGALPEEAEPRARLMWDSVAVGGRELVEDPALLQRWSFVMVASSSSLPAVEDKMAWQNEEFQVTLSGRSWSEAERQAFLDAPAPAEHE